MYVGVVRTGNLDPVRVVVAALGHETLLGRGVSDRFRITLEHGKRMAVEP